MKQCQTDAGAGTSACGYYPWLQGTSMASPHATGVAALAVERSRHSRAGSGFGMNPDAVPGCWRFGDRPHLPGGRRAGATWPRVATPPSPPTCMGNASRNGFYGEGIVNAWGVVR